MTNYNTVRSAIGAAVQAYSSDLNVYYYVPRTLVPPAVIVQPNPTHTISYLQAQSSILAEWNFHVLLVIGLLDETAAQEQAGELVSPGSPLVAALDNISLPNGFSKVTEGAISEMQFGNGLHTYVQLSVVVTA